MLEADDEVMADKGFDIQDLLTPVGAKLIMPPKLKSDSQMTASDLQKTKVLDNLSIHVERAIEHI